MIIWRRLFSEFTRMSDIRLTDIGANLTDPMFNGVYHGKQVHPGDLDAVLQRAFDTGVDKIIVTGGNLTDCQEALKLAKTNDRLYSTVGCHPTRCLEFEQTEGTTAEEYFQNLLSVCQAHARSKVIAIGECGLDYDRLHFCPKEIQKKYFEKQLELSAITGLPLFLHCRAAFGDFIDILKRNKDKINGGVVHSFDGSKDEAMAAIEFGLYIGLNGCSLKTENNLEVVKAIPADKILLETDAPWCEIRPTHASSKFVTTQFPPAKKKEKWESGCSVKSRNEPRNLLHVLEVVAGVKGMDVLQLAQQVFVNTCNLFKL
ncbi:deoxyribonuclease TATDN1-like [Dysidea avara]|uniref:deoxyribonuclease TATDN1-like n=1 Tax=Dysidea avara TaxID=196820 RepID=UPI0033239580